MGDKKTEMTGCTAPFLFVGAGKLSSSFVLSSLVSSTGRLVAGYTDEAFCIKGNGVLLRGVVGSLLGS